MSKSALQSNHFGQRQRFRLLSALLVALVGLQAVAAPVAGQTETQRAYVSFVADIEEDYFLTLENPSSPSINVLIQVQDQSLDPSQTSNNPAAATPLQYTFDISSTINTTDWAITFLPPALSLSPGQAGFVTMKVSSVQSPENAYYPFTLNLTATNPRCCEPLSQEFDFMAKSDGLQTLGAIVPSGGGIQKVAPDTIVEYGIQYTNPATEAKTFDMEVAGNSCDLNVVYSSFFLEGGETKTVPVYIESQNDRFFYAQSSCLVSIRAFATEGSSTAQRSTALIVQTQGFYIEPGVTFNLIFWTLVLAGILFLAYTAKLRAEEQLLGKPQPPWTLPAEQLYLRELAKKDPQAAYVVRNFLMEDEYKSALLWYNSFKRATRGRRKVERKLVKMERKFEKWSAVQQRRLAKTDAGADKKVALLQKQLDKKSKIAFKKEHKSWKSAVSKLETSAANELNKAKAQWRKDVKKAVKAGLSEPKEPKYVEPKLPDEPQHQRIMLDDHKWSSKKEKIYRQVEKREAKAEALYDRQREKRIKAMGKVLAKKMKRIEDRELVKEHPILQEAWKTVS